MWLAPAWKNCWKTTGIFCAPRAWSCGRRTAARFVRKLGADPEAFYETCKIDIDTRPANVVANIIICLIHQANHLLDRQLRQLEQPYLEEGGLRERMTRARLAARMFGAIGNR